MSAMSRPSYLRPLILLGLFVCASSVAVWSGTSVRSELERLQEQTGLSLVTLENWGIQVVLFSHRSVAAARRVPGIGVISPDGAEIAFAVEETMPGHSPHLGISRIDGNDLRKYPDIQMPPNNCLCWSNDESKLVTGAVNRSSFNPRLVLLTVSSNSTQEIANNGRVTSQCWSPDAQQFVYEMNGTMRVYNLEEGHSRLLANGREATWSPDGNQIAFLDGETYYVTRPAATERRALFKKWHPVSGLWWSPDSRFVAYVSQAGLLEGGLSLDVETYWLRVRRLEDNSEARVAGAGGGESYEWVTNTDLFKQAAYNYGRAPLLPPGHEGEAFIVGNVMKQGWYPVKDGETILQLVAAAGGLTPSARPDSIYIERTESNEHHRIPCHYTRALQGRERPVPLQPGDVIVVP